MEAIQEFSKVVLSQDNCIIPNERLRNTPSLKDGCPHDLEVELRIVGCEHIQTAGTLLRLPQVAMSTAQVLFQRFFYTKSLIKYNMMHVAMACIFLAAKIEENCRRVRDVANVFHHLKQKRMGSSTLCWLACRTFGLSVCPAGAGWQDQLKGPIVPMEYMGEEYFKIKASVIKYERFILRDLGFCVHVRNPHKLIIAYLQILELEKNKQLAQRSWNFMNDSLRTNVFVRYLPETIACSCIFLAARQLKIPLPQRPPWWTVFEVTYEDIEAVCLEVLALYRKPRLFLFDLEKRLNVLKEEYAKKQVEIKEVSLKKPVTDSPSDSPSKQSDNEVPQEKEKEPSPPTSSSVSLDKQRPSPLATTSQTSAPISSTAKQLSSSAAVTTSQSISPPPPPVTSLSLPSLTENNHTSKSSPPPPSKSKVDPPPLKKRKTSPNLTRNRVGSPPPVKRKVVISPIRVAASSGESISDGSLSPRENGLPEQYRRNRNKASSSSNSRHHHRRSRRSSLDRHRDRRRRDGSRKRRGQEERPKSRRTEHDRYR